MKVRIRHIDVFQRAHALLVGEVELIAFLPVQVVIFYIAYTQLRPLQVAKNGYVEREAFIDLLDVVDDQLMLFVCAVGEVEAEYIDPFLYQGQQFLISIAGRAYGSYYFGLV